MKITVQPRNTTNRRELLKPTRVTMTGAFAWEDDVFKALVAANHVDERTRYRSTKYGFVLINTILSNKGDDLSGAYDLLVEIEDPKFNVISDRSGVWYYFNRFDEKGESYWWNSLSWDCAKPLTREEAEAVLAKLQAKNPQGNYQIVNR